MIRPSGIAFTASIAVLLSLRHPAAAQLSAIAQLTAPPPTNSPAGSTVNTLHIHGAVVDGITGKSIARALVVSADRRLATMTNNEGAFSLDVTLTPGQNGGSSEFNNGNGRNVGPEIYLSAQRPGYLHQPEHPARIPLYASAQPEPVQIRLMPAAAITGYVSASGSDNARHITVDLLSQTTNNGQRTWNRMAVHRTESDGSFRFTDLNPGEYTVMTEEWRGDQPLPPEPDAVTEQYPPVFLGDTADLPSSQKLHLHFGETAPALLHLQLATYYPVTIPVTGATEGFVNVRITGAEGISGFRLGYAGNRHAVEGSLPDGNYGLELTGYPNGNRQPQFVPGRMAQQPERSYGITTLHIAGSPVHAAPVSLVVPAPVTVRIHRDFSGKDLPEHFQARVYLQPTEGGQSFVTANTEGGSEDEITLPGAAPGTYTVHIESSYGYAAQVRSGGADLTTEKLTVESGGAPPIDLVLRDDTATVSGTVTSGSGGEPENSLVLLSPANGGEGRFSMAGVGPDGKFTLMNVAPGSYRLFAIAGAMWDSPYRDPDALANVQGKGVAVSVTPNGALQVEVPIISVADLEAAQ